MANCSPDSTKGSCTPVYPYPSDGSCERPEGGTKTVGVPIFTPVIENPGDLIWRDEDFTPIQSDDDGTVFVFDNV